MVTGLHGPGTSNLYAHATGDAQRARGEKRALRVWRGPGTVGPYARARLRPSSLEGLAARPPAVTSQDTAIHRGGIAIAFSRNPKGLDRKGAEEHEKSGRPPPT